MLLNLKSLFVCTKKVYNHIFIWKMRFANREKIFRAICRKSKLYKKKKYLRNNMHFGLSEACQKKHFFPMQKNVPRSIEIRSIFAIIRRIFTSKNWHRCQFSSWVDFINVFTQSFYTGRSQKRKKLLDLTVFFALLGSSCVKLLVKCCWNWPLFSLLLLRWCKTCWIARNCEEGHYIDNLYCYEMISYIRVEQVISRDGTSKTKKKHRI